ncbi:MAG: DMT family transporter [Saprospiraceae bacterium]
MNNTFLFLLSFLVGMMVVIQGSINARLGVLLNSALLATTTALVISASFTVVATISTVRNFPSIDKLQAVPAYMWFSGGVFSFLAVTLFYYIIPRVGISTAVTFGLAGQVLFAAIASHFGWFGMPIESITTKKVMGMMVMIISVIIIKS